MKERPILFNAPMVRALLDGSKTQTRRVVKPQPYIDEQGNFCWNGSNFGQDGKGPHTQAIASPIQSSKTKRVRCPYGKPGDRLWVRETWRAVWSSDNQPPHELDAAYRIWYEADAPLQDGHGKLRPSIHMPRWASRITLEIVSVRVERLQDISESDARAEGARECDPVSGREVLLAGASQRGSFVLHYRDIWEQINGPGSWDANPWVWVVEFKRVTP